MENMKILEWYVVCLRELQNFDGRLEDIRVVCSLSPRIAKL